jgi:hypothetical protein
MAVITRAPTAPINVTFTLTSEKAPYFTAWYLDNKLPVETPGDFLIRMLLPSVVDYVSHREQKRLDEVRKNEIDAIRLEAQQIKNGL